MRFLFLASCVAFVMSFALAAPLQAKGGKGGGGGGGGGGRPNSGGGHGGGGPHAGHAGGGSHGDAEHGEKHHDGSHADKHQGQDRDRDHDGDEHHRSQPRNPATGPSAGPGGSANSPTNALSKQHQLLIEQQNRDHKLAQAQHLREIAQRNGNPNLLANADRMQAEAQAHYAQRLAQLEKFGVTDPALNPGGITNPPVAGGILPATGQTPANVIQQGINSLNLRPFRP